MCCASCWLFRGTNFLDDRNRRSPLGGGAALGRLLDHRRLLLVNAGVGFREEFKADNAIEALKKRLAPSARVLRDGRWRDIAAVRLVPGDVVFLRLGNIVPVDVELLDGEYLSVDQLAPDRRVAAGREEAE